MVRVVNWQCLLSHDEIFVAIPFQLDPKYTLQQDVLHFLSNLKAKYSDHIASSTLTIKRLKDLPFIQQIVVNDLDAHE